MTLLFLRTLVFVAVLLVAPTAADGPAGLRLALSPAVAAPGDSDTAATERLIPHIRAMPTGVGAGPALGAIVSSEGHWTLVNAAGERLTAANADEMRRILPLLTGLNGEAEPRIILFDDGGLHNRAHLAILPPAASLSILVGSSVLPLERRGEDILAAVRPGVRVALTDQPGFDEALHQLARPLGRSRLRVISLATDGPETLPRQSPFDASGEPAADVIDAFKLPAALSSLTRQTVVVTGRVEGSRLVFHGSAGTEHAILLHDLTSAAARHDVDLVLLQTTSARQPGTRNWLWQRIEVAGLDRAREHPTFADFLDALAGSDRDAPIVVRFSGFEEGRARLVLSRRPASGLGGLFTDLTAGVTGRIVGAEAQAWMVGSQRLGELRQRIIPGIPAVAQYGYLVLVLAGLLGLPAALRWWAALWPPEQRDDYDGAAGYHAARAVKSALFAALFLPIVGPAAALWTIVRTTGAAIVRPWRRTTTERDKTPRQIEGRPT